jgi:cytochrome c oxidase assembly protein subunit 15
LVGVSIGILIFLTAWASRIYLKQDKSIFYLAVSVFFLVGFQGWLGAVVVASNLKPFIITMHMLLAMVIVMLLIYAISKSQHEYLAKIDSQNLPAKVKTVLIIAMLLTLAQVIMGTQVREAVDFIANEHKYINREFWRDSFPLIFYVHRSFSALILLTNLWIVWKIHRHTDQQNVLRRSAYALIGLISLAILAGISLDRLGVPPVAQPIHLLIANLIFGMQFFIYICLYYSSKNK